MPTRLDTRSPDFPARFRDFLGGKRESAEDVEASARAIIADVVARGDQELVDLTKKFDRLDTAARGLRVTSAELDAAAGKCDREAIAALILARDRIDAYHRKQ